MDESRLIALKVFNSRSEAEIAAAALRAYGFESTISPDDAGGMLAPMGSGSGVKLLVLSAQADAAKLVLDHELSSRNGFNASSEDPQAASGFTRMERMLFALIVGILIGGGAHWLYTEARTRGERTFSYDLSGDGRDDEVWVYANGSPVSRKVDQNRDGIFDYWERYEDGFLSHYEQDQNRDGKVDLWGSYQPLDLSGQVSMDTDFDGTPDSVTFCMSSLIQRTDWLPNGTTNIVKRDLYSHGVYTEELHDLDRNGTFDISIRFDFMGNPISTNPVLRSLENTP
jgi:hypothetical protein